MLYPRIKKILELKDNYQLDADLSDDQWGFTADEEISLGEKGALLVVCDGMGGMNAGEVASELAVNCIRDSFSKVKDFSKITDCSNHVEAFLKKTIVEADAVI